MTQKKVVQTVAWFKTETLKLLILIKTFDKKKKLPVISNYWEEVKINMGKNIKIKHKQVNCKVFGKKWVGYLELNM